MNFTNPVCFMCFFFTLYHGVPSSLNHHVGEDIFKEAIKEVNPSILIALGYAAWWLPHLAPMKKIRKFVGICRHPSQDFFFNCQGYQVMIQSMTPWPFFGLLSQKVTLSNRDHDINYAPICRGIKQCKCMVVLRDFPLILLMEEILHHLGCMKPYN